MIKRVFFSCSYINRGEYVDFYNSLKEYFGSNGVEFYTFVFDYTGAVDDHTLMTMTLREIESSDLVLVELSDKSVGVGLEAGYAKAKGKKIGYLYKRGSDLQQTVNGVADYLIRYDRVEEVKLWFEKSGLLVEG
jgi:hypothetical protein